ncbi:MAG: ankyrin repeat domain-containing protein, partial [Methylophilaceae bacterium]|nr:ankyrin repeat domain-containing protein [Methylophilaceae bacterium]
VTALERAAGNGHLDAVAYLLEQGATNENTPGNNAALRQKTALMWAAGNGHSAVVHWLLTHGASVNTQDTKGNTALHWAAGESTWNKTTEQVPTASNVTALPEASAHSKAESDNESATAGIPEKIPTYLLPRQTDTRTEQERHTEYTQTVQTLLAAGADIQIAGDTGMTPLHSAIVSGNVANAQAIIAAAPDKQTRTYLVNAREKSDYERTPILLALRHCQGATEKRYKLNNHETTQALLRLLIANDADTTKGDDKKCTPILWTKNVLKWPAETELLDIWPMLCTACTAIRTTLEHNPEQAKTIYHTMLKDLMRRAKTYATDTTTLQNSCDTWLTLAHTELGLERLAHHLSAPDWNALKKELQEEQKNKYVPPHLRRVTQPIEKEKKQSTKYVPPHLKAAAEPAEEENASEWTLVEKKTNKIPRNSRYQSKRK